KRMLYDLTGGGNTRSGNYTPAPVSDNIVPSYTSSEQSYNQGGPSPIVIHHSDNTVHHEDVEETLSLADREKEFILKALKKHKGRRRDAASELGISERTLYRKIKEYDINE